MKIALTSVVVNDPSEAFSFYTEILGFVEVLYQPEAQIAIVASPEDRDGTALMLEPNGNPVAKEFQQAIYAQGLPVIMFGVDDIQKEYERLCELGVEFRKPPTQADWGIETVFEDTCGNLVLLAQIG